MLKLTEDDLAQRAEGTIRGLLAEIPFLELISVETELAGMPYEIDLVIRVRDSNDEWLLVFERKTRGEPRLARTAVAQLRMCCERLPNAYGVFLAPYISPAAAEVCREANIGYVDLSGNCRLSFGRVFVEREGRENKFAEKRDLRTLYSPRASRVLRALLAEPRRSWTVADLAKEADVSLGLVSNVKRLLEDREWLSGERGAISLEQPKEMLTEWSENYSFEQNEAYDFYSRMNPSQVEADLAQTCAARGISYALTAFSAAARMAPMVRYQRVFVYVDGAPPEVAGELGLKQVTSGPNVTLLVPYDEGVFLSAREFEGVRTVSPVQAYLDLVGMKGRGEEAAKSILEEVIKPRW